MDKALTRITVIVVAIYLVASYILAQIFGIDILRYSYILLFESCVVAYTFCGGKYHCRYIRWTALSVLISDVISHTDYYFDYIPVSIYNIIPLSIIAVGITTSITLSVKHFYRVYKYNKSLREHKRIIPN
jgi:hypothetical protein